MGCDIALFMIFFNLDNSKLKNLKYCWCRKSAAPRNPCAAPRGPRCAAPWGLLAPPTMLEVGKKAVGKRRTQCVPDYFPRGFWESICSSFPPPLFLHSRSGLICQIPLCRRFSPPRAEKPGWREVDQPPNYLEMQPAQPNHTQRTAARTLEH